MTVRSKYEITVALAKRRDALKRTREFLKYTKTLRPTAKQKLSIRINEIGRIMELVRNFEVTE